MDIIKAKIKQATELLDEFHIDMWLVFVRETVMQADPVMAMLVGKDVTWQSFFLFTRSHGAMALIGNFDEDDFKKSGRFDRVIPYTEGVKQDFLKILDEVEPRSIALNYSLDDPGADGLTHGMYLQLREYLHGTPFDNRLTSAADLSSRLRARKLPEEIALLEHAAKVSDGIWKDAVTHLKPGLTEKQIAAMIDERIAKAGGECAFETIVNAGAKTAAGHVTPTDARIEAGEVLHVDFGAKIDGYCADIQRLAYCKPGGETAPPAEVSEAFDLVRDIITETGTLLTPGNLGVDLDKSARTRLIENGYEEYHHALGHQLGRDVHDGGGILGPKWERYGRLPMVPLELNNVFTLELEIMLPGIGCIGLEEDAVVSESGARFISPRQERLDII